MFLGKGKFLSQFLDFDKTFLYFVCGASNRDDEGLAGGGVSRVDFLDPDKVFVKRMWGIAVGIDAREVIFAKEGVLVYCFVFGEAG